MAGGAKGKYHRWLEPDGLVLLTGWARDGLTMAQIAHNCGVGETRLYEWRKSHAEIEGALKKGREVADYYVECALYNKAVGGDVTAMIFWLKNRSPNKWRNNPEGRAAEGSVTIADDL